MLDRAKWMTADRDVYEVVYGAVSEAVSGAVDEAVDGVVDEAVNWAIVREVARAR